MRFCKGATVIDSPAGTAWSGSHGRRIGTIAFDGEASSRLADGQYRAGREAVIPVWGHERVRGKGHVSRTSRIAKPSALSRVIRSPSQCPGAARSSASAGAGCGSLAGTLDVRN